jgi:Concanavalin A-like lectin/glucanases superfamily
MSTQPALAWTFDNTLTDYVTGLTPSAITTGAYAASGGTITASGTNRIHKFTTVGTSSITFTSPGNIQLLLVAGGGGGGSNSNGNSGGGGGGAGEVAYYASYPVNAGTYTVVVGDGGVGGTTTGTIDGADGSPSSFGTLQANGGGGGTSGNNGPAYTGGSGGGCARGFTGSGGASVKTAGGLGNAGGANANLTNYSGAGGGGAGSAGTAASTSGTTPIPGGSGYTSSISGASVTYGSGGTGGARNGTYTPSAGTTNQGDGGDGAPGGGTAGSNALNGANGGSGIVIVSYSASTFAPTFVSGEYRKAIYFQNSINTGTVIPQSNVYYTVPLNSSTGYTIAFWVNFNIGGIFAQMPLEVSLSSGGRGVSVYLNATNFLLSYDGTTNITATPAISVGTWNHVAIVIQGATRVLYVNGVGFSGTSALTGTQTGFIIGGGLTTYSAWCSLDDLQIFNTALNVTQVQALYAVNGTPPPAAQLNMAGISASACSVYGGTTFFSQISPTSAVVAYSLRAVNTPNALTINVRPEIALPSMTSAATSIGSNSYSQSLTSSFPSGGSGTYIARGSSLYNGTTNPAWRAFDNDTTTFWETTVNQYSGSPGTVYGGTQTTTVGGTAYPGEWIQIQMPTALVLSSYSMYGRVNYTFRMPYNWIVAGSNDGTTWTQIDSRSTQGAWRGQEPISYTVVSTTAYLYFRLVVTAIVSATGLENVNLGQWTINGSNASWTTDVTSDIFGNLTTSAGQSLSSYLGTSTGFVTTWYDQSGAGNHATQTTKALQPIVQKASVGPGYSILFDGMGDYLTGMSYTVMTGTNYSFSLIERRNVSGNLVAIGSGNSGTDKAFHFFYFGGNVVRFGQYADDLDINPYPDYSYTSEPIHYWAGTESSTAGRFIYEKGAVSISDATKTTLLSSTAGNFIVGKSPWSSQYYYSGEIYEVIIWTRALASSEASKVYFNQSGYINGNPGAIVFY